MASVINVNTTGLVTTPDNSGSLQLQTGGTAAITFNADSSTTFNKTDALQLPSGTTAQRPSSPIEGSVRYNSDIYAIETYLAGSWTVVKENLPTYTIAYVAVGGGGSGSTGGNYGGGGGAGKVLESTVGLYPSSTYTVTIGSGGSGGSNGSSSTVAGFGITTITSVGGNSGSGQTGGSSGNGYTGGTGPNAAGGGGAGAGANGQSVTGGTGGNGGGGVATSITGSSVTYAGGGGGGGLSRGYGSNGGGNGGVNDGSGNFQGSNASGNTGSGGGGAVNSTAGQGGSGIIILSVPTDKYTGTVTGSPTVTTNGSNTVIKYTSSGTYTA